VRVYGAANVVDQEVGVGAGDTDFATILFPSDPQRSIQILWMDPNKKTAPLSATIQGTASRWHAVHGISLGASYSDLERLNGKPFPISWGTDQGNVVLSWKGGRLDKDLKNEGVVFVWFDDAASKGSSQNQIPGSESNRGRRVNQIAWEFPHPTP
jgi:hypothetical protein